MNSLCCKPRRDFARIARIEFCICNAGAGSILLCVGNRLRHNLDADDLACGVRH